MKKTFNALKLPSIFLLMIISFIACDKDFSTIDSDVLGKENSNFTSNHESLPVLAYNKKLEALQINGLASYLLGVFNDDPVYGKTTASIVTQVSPSSFDPDFGTNTSIDSVILKIPYFSRITGTDDDGYATYTIQDSLYGDYNPNIGAQPFKLSVYQNNYFLRDFDPSFGLDVAQLYYSKADGTVNNTDNFALNGSSVINFDTNKGTLLHQTVFTPDAVSEELWEISTTDTDAKPIKTRIVPQLRMKLDTLFWSNTIIKKEDDAVLSDSDNFNNYFRGLYFKAEAKNENGSMVLLNLASKEANIIIYYSKDSTVKGERTQSTYTLNFTGNTLNTFINDFSVTLQNGDETLGDEKLYLKGAEGSMATVDLFADLVECENEDGSISTIPALECFIKSYRKTDINDNYIKENGTGDYLLKRLINDAQLIIFEDEIMQTLPQDEAENDYSTYDRIYAYDLDNNQPTIDYFFDVTENTSQPFNSKFISLGQRSKDDKGNAKYKIRLTEHLNNILLKDSTNTKIGLVLSTNVNYTNNAQTLLSDNDVTAIPAASILTPRGTVLYGTNTSNKEKKMRLEIFFTEPNN